MLLGFEMAGKRFAPGGLRLFLRCALGVGLLGCLGALFERALLLALDNGRWRGWQRCGWGTSLTLLALRYSEQLADSIIETSELLDELRILLEKSCELSTLLGILLSQRFQLVHRQ